MCRPPGIYGGFRPLCDAEIVYRHHDPQNSPYYQCVEGHFETFELVYDARFKRQYGFFRPYVKRVIYRYLDCGILKNGFARGRCDGCGYEYLLAFSCKRRHFRRPKIASVTHRPHPQH